MIKVAISCNLCRVSFVSKIVFHDKVDTKLKIRLTS